LAALTHPLVSEKSDPPFTENCSSLSRDSRPLLGPTTFFPLFTHDMSYYPRGE
jgi:hypothetical protein